MDERIERLEGRVAMVEMVAAQSFALAALSAADPAAFMEETRRALVAKIEGARFPGHRRAGAADFVERFMSAVAQTLRDWRRTPPSGRG
jgi:hypothetical protein